MTGQDEQQREREELAKINKEIRANNEKIREQNESLRVNGARVAAKETQKKELLDLILRELEKKGN